MNNHDKCAHETLSEENYCAEIAALKAEVERLKGLCPHAQDGACLDWAHLANKRKATIDRLTKEHAEMSHHVEQIHRNLHLLAEVRWGPGGEIETLTNRALAAEARVERLERAAREVVLNWTEIDGDRTTIWTRAFYAIRAALEEP